MPQTVIKDNGETRLKLRYSPGQVQLLIENTTYKNYARQFTSLGAGLKVKEVDLLIETLKLARAFLLEEEAAP